MARLKALLLVILLYAVNGVAQQTAVGWKLESNRGSTGSSREATTRLDGTANGVSYAFALAARCEPQRLVFRLRADEGAAGTVGSVYAQIDHLSVQRMELARPSAPGSGESVEISFPVASTVFSAHVLRLQIGLPGALPVIEIRPEDASFRAFLASCGPQAETAVSPVTIAGKKKQGDGNPRPQHPTRVGKGVDFSGSLNQFAAALDGYITKAAKAVGAPPRSWAFEEKEIVDAARLCSGVTPQMADSVNFYGRTDFSKLGEYKVCGATMGAGLPEPPDSTGKPAKSIFFMDIKPVGNWGDGQGIGLTLSFTETGFPGVPEKNTMAYYGVLSATIEVEP